MDFFKKLKLTIAPLLAFSKVPIQTISIIGAIDCMLSILYAMYIIVQKLAFSADIGWSAVIVAIMFALGIQLLTLGVIGEYLWRNFEESRKRPLYILDEKHGL